MNPKRKKMRIDYSKQFLKQFRKAPLKIQISFRKRLEIFTQDKSNPILDNHTLKGNRLGCSSINVTGDWRALFNEFEGGKLIYFYAIGTHCQLYG